MISNTPNIASRNILSNFAIAAILSGLGLLVSYAQQTKQPQQKSFATPQQAAQALIQAADPYNVAALTEILGPDSKDLVASQDPTADQNRAMEFATLARENQTVVVDPKNPNYAGIVVGSDEWPFPIPIVKRNGKWYYDTRAGRQEILFRRIGENELDAIEVCRGFVEAQKAYAFERHDGSLLNQYAQKIISTPGKHDGLAWQNPDGTWGGPVGEAIARAIQEGYAPDRPAFHGYYFKVLKGQGPAAPLGSMNFVVEGAMIGGFALAAAPAQYRVTGVKTFIVSHEGIVYQKDLGPDTPALFKAMELYNPDKTWNPTDDAQ